MKVRTVLHVALSANDRYMPGAVVAAAGVAAYANPETSLHFHLFAEEVKSVTFDFFAATLKRIHKNTEVSRHECDEKVLDGLPYWAGSRMAAVRCNYATLMPDVDWCLYLDCDVLYLSSVDEHFSYRDENVYACVVQEEHEGTRRYECAWIEENCGVHIPNESYFNSGVVLFNLAKMRRDGIPKRLMDFFRNHPDVPSPDQDALNLTLGGCVKFLSPKFNRLQIFLDDKKMLERPVIHYVCGNPWLPKYGEVASYRFRLWHAFADKHIWGKKGESYKRSFTRKILIVKYLSYYILKMPVLWHVYVKVLSLMRLIVCPTVWRRDQVMNDFSAKSLRKALGE